MPVTPSAACDSGALACLDHWQTLASGALALFAALIGAVFIYAQIRQSSRHERERREGRYAAVRATMPLTLSALAQYADDSATALRQVLAQRVGEEVPVGVALPDLPQVPEQAVRSLQELVEAAPPAIRDVVSDLLGDVQVQSGRMRGMFAALAVGAPPTHITLVVNVEEAILDAVDLYTSASSLFDFARRRTLGAPSPPTWKEVSNSLHILRFYDYEFPDLHETAKRRAKPAAAA